MVDLNSQFFAILTAVGEAKQANADALGIPWKLTHMGVGDANGTDPIPNHLQTSLIREKRRAQLNQLKVDPNNPAVIVAEQVIPPDVGGWWIREIGLYDEAGDLVAVANCAPSFKPVLSQGSGRTQVVRMNFIVSSTGNITLKIDPSVVLATRQYVDESLESQLPGDKVPGTYRQVLINKYGIVQSGSNPTTLAGYGITDSMLTTPQTGVVGKISDITKHYIGVYASGTTDGMTNSSGGLFLRMKYPGAAPVAFDIFGHVGNGYDVFGFRRVLADGSYTNRTVFHDGNFDPALKANLASPTFTGTVLVPSLPAGTNDQRAACTAFVQAAIARLVGSAPEALDQLNELATALGNDPNFATTITNALSTKAPLASPTFTGEPLAPTAPVGDNSQKLASTNFVTLAFNRLVVSATETVKGIARFATQAEVNAGTDDATSVTPKKMRAGFSVSLAANGYVMFPTWLGGLIVQWGLANVGDDAIVAVPLPIAFPNTFFAALATAQSPNAVTGSGNLSASAHRTSLNTITVGMNVGTGSGFTVAGVSWLALGV